MCIRDRPISAKNLQNIVRGISEQKIRTHLEPLNQGMAAAGITSCQRIAAYLAFILVETQNLDKLEETGNDGYFQAAYENKCQELGNCKSGDGQLFRGRGTLYLKGRSSYRLAGKNFKENFEQHPELVADPKFAHKIGAWHWSILGLNFWADQNAEQGLDQIATKVYGCVNCLNDAYAQKRRKTIWNDVRQELGCANHQANDNYFQWRRILVTCFQSAFPYYAQYACSLGMNMDDWVNNYSIKKTNDCLLYTSPSPRDQA
eukprot:TRINITY_DN7997_c0_g1_i2.p1 TRINITY_DN7997_c0_g1~~TRINITY_DN7997_c0_g1_i2.p1  ORF type:complete len:260 (-),score=49.97 TRINITY_DN7997_c0_g1_i2:36-815(-)